MTGTFIPSRYPITEHKSYVSPPRPFTDKLNGLHSKVLARTFAARPPYERPMKRVQS